MNKREEYKISGMSCTSCANNIEKTVASIEGVKFVKVNFANKRLTVNYNSSSVKAEKIISEVKNRGFELSSDLDSDKSDEKHLRREKIRLITAWSITLPLSIKMLLHMIWGIHIVTGLTSLIIDMILSFVVIFIVGLPVIKATWRSFRSFNFNMDSLIGIGSIAAFSSGVLILLGVSIENFVSIGAMIISINFIGNYLKLRATGRASSAIRQLLELGSKSASLLDDKGNIRKTPVEELIVGDIVLIKPGEKVPVDGLIIDGSSTIDESIATGESIPVDKTVGDRVIGGTINYVGVIKVKIEKLGSETFLSRIIELVKEAQGSKVPIQAFADKVTAIFVPVILVIALLTFLFWLFLPEVGKEVLNSFKIILPWIGIDRDVLSTALYATIASLVIACPCALGLATPTALMVGMGKGALNGILIRNGEAIQRAKDLDYVVFDKTGTITQGRPVLNHIETSIDSNAFLKIAASVERHSEHPLGRAIVAEAELRELKLSEPKEFKAIPGRGLRALIDEDRVLIGSISYLDGLGYDISNFQSSVSKYLSMGHTVIGLVINEVLKGIITISDPIKPDSKDAIERLKELGIKTVMLTGDNSLAAEAIAKEVGITGIESELLPEDKIKIIKGLQSQGKVVAMVGDGINDAPALKQSDVGIAIGTGTDIAIEAADITLVSGSLTGVVKGIKLSKATFKKIKQNLFWAFIYNVIAIPLAVLAILHPAAAEIAMAISSINVVLNSLRLRNINI